MKLIKSLHLKSGEEIELIKISGLVENPKNILIIGVFHGEEPQGYYAVKNYLNNVIKNNSFKNNVYFIPCLNPDGMEKNERKNCNGVDLNRNFPTKNWELSETNSDYFGGKEPASEDETKFVIEIISEIKPDFILTLHSPYAVVNYDGPATDVAEIISKLSDYSVQSDIGYPTPGSFGTYCGVERNIPVITLEYSDTENLNSIFEKSNKVFDWLIKEY